ncbi:hypothetical protein OG204_00700 [Streptomyces sp. NBC_01387]|nr:MULTISPECIES: hypothetical protein [unclassified Streptomyces]MCX4553168.1 hypothetical protein [Streptomyces sp. NBC_01500]
MSKAEDVKEDFAVATGKIVEALRSGLEKVRTLEQVSGIKADY